MRRIIFCASTDFDNGNPAESFRVFACANQCPGGWNDGKIVAGKLNPSHITWCALRLVIKGKVFVKSQKLLSATLYFRAKKFL